MDDLYNGGQGVNYDDDGMTPIGTDGKGNAIIQSCTATEDAITWQ